MPGTTLPIVEEFNTDPRYQALDYDTKKAVLGGLFDDHLADSRFHALDSITQGKVKDLFFEDHLGMPPLKVPGTLPEQSRASFRVQSKTMGLAPEVDIQLPTEFVPQFPAETVTPRTKKLAPAIQPKVGPVIPLEEYTAPPVSLATTPKSSTPAKPAEPSPAEKVRDMTNYFNTPLMPNELPKFQEWVKKMSAEEGRDISKDIQDYDLAGYWKSGLWMDAEPGQHGPDTFKKPSHPTFSDESIYSDNAGTKGPKGGHWENVNGVDTFMPSSVNYQFWPPAEIQKHFNEREPNAKLLTPTWLLGELPELRPTSPDQLWDTGQKVSSRLPVKELSRPEVAVVPVGELLEKGWDRVKNKFEPAWEDKRFRDNLVDYYSKTTGRPPEQINKEMGPVTSRAERIVDRNISNLITGMVAVGAITNPVVTVMNVGTFVGMEKALHAAYGLFKKSEKELTTADILLPEDASRTARGIVNGLEFIGLGILTGGGLHLGKLGLGKAKPVIDKFTKNTIETYHIPDVLYIEPEKMQDIFQKGDKISPEEFKLVQGLGLDAAGYKQAFKNGVYFETEKVVHLVDKPWFGKFKELVSLGRLHPQARELDPTHPYRTTLLLTPETDRPVEANVFIGEPSPPEKPTEHPFTGELPPEVPPGIPGIPPGEPGMSTAEPVTFKPQTQLGKWADDVWKQEEEQVRQMKAQEQAQEVAPPGVPPGLPSLPVEPTKPPAPAEEPELPQGLTPAQMNFVDNRLARMKSKEEVDAAYPSAAPIDQYARRKAEELFGEPEVAEPTAPGAQGETISETRRITPPATAAEEGTLPPVEAGVKTGEAATPDKDLIFVREGTSIERAGGVARRNGYNAIPDKEGYEKVYKPYGPTGGKKGSGYYYQAIKQEPAIAEKVTVEPVKGERAAPEPASTEIKVEKRVTEPIKEPAQKTAKITPVETSKRVNLFRSAANTLQKQIDQKRHPAIAEQRLTRRRAGIASGMAADADNLEKIQNVLRGMADDLESGTLPVALGNIKSKSQIEDILNRTWRGVSPIVRKSNVKELLDGLKGAKGISEVKDNLRQLLFRSPATEGGYAVAIYGENEINGLEELVKLADKARLSNYTITDVKNDVLKAKHLISAGLDTEEKFNAADEALKQYLVPPSEKVIKEQKLKSMERELIGTKIPGFFPTPKSVINIILERAEIKPGMTVLEPSAGKGDIADEISKLDVSLDLYEINPTLAKILRAKDYKVVQDDFLGASGKFYDRIIMNPPFEQGQDIDHVKKAYELLLPGGRLVSIMSVGPFFREDKKSTAFREWFEKIGGISEKVPERVFATAESFRQTGTSSKIVTIDKPVEGTSEAKPTKLSLSVKPVDLTLVPTKKGFAWKSDLGTSQEFPSRIEAKNARRDNGLGWTKTPSRPVPVKRGGMDADVLKKELDPLSGKLVPKIHIVQNADNLPIQYSLHVAKQGKRGKNVRGFFDPETEEIWIIADAIDTPKEGVGVVIHEAMHYGIRALADKVGMPLDEFLKPLINSKAYGPDIFRLAEDNKWSLPKAADEWFADKVRTDKVEPSLWSRFLFWFKKVLRKLGVRIEFGRVELQDMIRRAYEVAEKKETIAGEQTPTREGAIAASAELQKGEWYSQMSKVIASKLPGFGTAESFRKAIQSWADKGEFKKEELDWLGLLDDPTSPLAKEGKVNKKEVLDWLMVNNVRVETVIKGKDPFAGGDLDLRSLTSIPEGITLSAGGYLYLNEGATVKMEMKNLELQLAKQDRGFSKDEESGEYFLLDEQGEPINPAEWTDEQEKIIGRLVELDKRILPTKFASYQTPGGENYREILLTLPVKKSIPTYETYERTKRELPEELPFRDPHWDEPNVVAHLRVNDRIDIQGRKGFFIEEVQSGWHLKGRREGYGDPIKIAELWQQKIGLGKEMERNHKELYENSQNNEEYNRLKKLGIDIRQRLFKIKLQIEELSKSVPDAPFKKSWPMLCFKKALRMAVEEGKDFVAWTTGEQQASRYDLSKHLDRIEYEKIYDEKTDEPNGLYEVIAYDKSGKQVIHEDEIGLDRIEELAGKGIAEKIKNDEGTIFRDRPYRGWKKLSGLDLKVGGEWAKNLYDLQLPNEINKYVKKWGGRVGETDIITTEAINGASEGEEITVHSVDITPAMREAALAGQPLFKTSENYVEINRQLQDVNNALATLPDRLNNKSTEIIRDRFLNKKEELEQRLAGIRFSTKETDKSRLEKKIEMLESKLPEKGKNEVLRYRMSTLINQQIKNIKSGYYLGQLDLAQSLEETKQLIFDYARKNLPPEMTRGQVNPLLREVAQAKNIDDVESAYGRIRKITRTQTEKGLRSNIVSLLKKYKPKKKEGILKGTTLTADDYKKLDNIRAIIKMKEDEVSDIAERIWDKADNEQRELTIDESELIYQLDTFGGLLAPKRTKTLVEETGKEVFVINPDKSVEQLKRAEEDLNSLIQYGRTKRAIKEESRIEKLNVIKEKSTEILTAGKELKTEEQIQVEGGPYKRNMFGNFNLENLNLEYLLDELSKKEKGVEPLHGYLNSTFMPIVDNARDAERKGTRESMELVQKKMTEIFGTNSPLKLNGIASKNREPVNTGIFIEQGAKEIIDENGESAKVPGKQVELVLSQNQAYKLWQEWQDPSLAGTFSMMGYTREAMDQIESFLDPRVKAWAEWQMKEFYPDYYKSVDDAYTDRFDVHLGYNPFYTPISRVYGKIDANDEPLLTNNKNHYTTVINNHLRSRIRNIRPLKLLDGDQVLINHIIEMEHFKAWAKPMRDLRGVFNSEEVRTAITQYHGKYALRKLDDNLNDLSRGGIDLRLMNGVLDGLRTNFTTAELGVNLTMIPKQISSMFAYAVYMPVGRFFEGCFDFFTNPIVKINILKQSEFIKDRYREGWDRDVKLAMQRSAPQRLAGIRNIRDILMFPSRIGDKASVLVGGWSLYKYNYNKTLKEGKSIDEARKIAMREFEMVTRRTQQSGEIEDLPSLMRGGSWARLFTMFITQPNSYFRIANASLRNFARGRGSRFRNLKAFAIVWFILPALFQWVANSGRWSNEDELRAAVVGPLNGLLIVGDWIEEIVQHAVAGLLGAKTFFFGGDSSPVFSNTAEAVRAVDHATKMIKRNDYNWKEVSFVLDKMAKISSDLSGVPYSAPKRTIQGVLRIIENPKDPNAWKQLGGYSKWALGEEKKKKPVIRKPGTPSYRGFKGYKAHKIP